MNVLITGAAGGLGRAFVNECARRGYFIIATDVNKHGLSNIRQGIEYRFGKSILTYQCDITSQESIDILMKQLEDKEIGIDMLLNVAGLESEGNFKENSFENINKIIQLNILGTLRITHNVLSRRFDKRPLYIVNVSSLAAKQPIPLKATYAASKRFLLDFTYALAQEQKHDSVKVLALCSGGLATNVNVIQRIEAQGFFGTITTCRIEKTVHRTINKVLKGKTIYIPGIFNKFTTFLGYFIPVNIKTKILYKRWFNAQSTWLTK